MAKNRTNRFKTIAEIEWLDHADRKKYRNSIKSLQDLTLLMERGQELTPLQEATLMNLSKSTARDTQMNTLWNMIDSAEMEYYGKLAAMAPHDLTAYHELLNPTQPPAQHHILLCDYLMKVERGELLTLIVALPPGAAKSTYASRSFAQWVLGRNPDWEIFACGHTQRFAEDEFSKPNRRAIDSDLFRSAFPDVFLNPSEKGASMWRLDGWRGKYAVRGAESNTSGLRARLVLADDLFGSAADAMSAVKRETVWRWWTADVMNRRLPSAPTVLVNTLWHSEDVPGRIKKMHDEDPESVPLPYKFLSIPAQAEEEDELGREPGEWLWCKEQQEDGFYSIKDYQQKQASTPPSLWSALFMNKPLDKFGDFIAEDEFTRYDSPPINRDNAKVEWTKTVISVDCAQKGSERSDYTAILVFRVHVDGTHYIVDAWRGKEVLDKVVRIISKLMRLWQANYALIEDSGMGTQVIENYQGKLPAPIMKYTPSGKGSKEFRFDAACPWIRAGRVVFPQNNVTWVHPLINEMIAFPNGAHDDWVDAFSQYTDHELKSRVGGTKKLKTRI